MTDDEYLREVLRSQTLKPDGDELKALQKHREDVEQLLREGFDNCTPTIRYGGSKAKDTMIKEAYDLDIICYFPHDDTDAGETLEDIFGNVREVLARKYLVQPKRSALQLLGLDPEHYQVNFHVDVVPGRYIDDAKADVFLYCTYGKEKRLKTNLDVHIEHVRDSGLTEAIRLMKLWRVRNEVTIKHFVLELLTIKLLKEHKSSPLTHQLRHVWQELKEHIDDLAVEDPANPTGNDLSELFDASIRASLSSVASSTLQTLDDFGWESVFVIDKAETTPNKIESFRRMAVSVSRPTKPWRG